MNSKALAYNGNAGGFFVAFLVVMLTAYIPVFGWPIGLNFMSGWIMDNLEVNGNKVKYSAGYGESLVFILVNVLLVIVTLGIYTFWFYPKMYRYIVDHTSYVGATAVEAQAMPAPQAVDTPVAPAAPSAPSAPTQLQ